MQRYALEIGLVLLRGEQHLEVKRLLNDGQVVLENQQTGMPCTLSVGQVAKGVADGKLQVLDRQRISLHNAEEPQDSPPQLYVQSLDSVPAKYRAEALCLRELISQMRRAGLTRGMRRGIETKLNSMRSTKQRCQLRVSGVEVELPSATKLMRAWRDYDDSGGMVSSLVSGNVHRKVPSRLHDDVRKVITQKLRSHYCKPDRPPLRMTLGLINKALGEEQSVSETTVRRALGDMDRYAVTAARFGKAHARNHWRFSLKGNHATRALERVEVDHTLLDLVVVCDRTGMPLGRPTVTVVVDGYSGYVLGFFISFWGTGLAPTLAAIKQAILPKEDIVASMSLTHRWLAWGLPEMLVLDNGLEFHSPQFRLAAMHLGCDILFCPVRQPWLKGVVERTMLDLKMSLPAQGLVRKTLSNELPIDSKGTAAVRFSDLCFGLLKAFVDVHPFEINQRKLTRPYELFAESLDELPPLELPVDTKQLDLLSCLNKELTVGNEGIVHQYLRWNSHELQDLRRRTGHTFRTRVKISPEDLGTVYVQDIRSKEWLSVPSCAPSYANGLSLVQHRAIRSSKQNELTQRNAVAVLERGKAELHEHWNSAVKAGRSLKRRHEKLAQLQCLTSAQVFQGATPTAPSPVKAVPLFDEAPLPTRDIPTYESFSLD